uniref:Centromere protein M n=1 Tax=Mola mola TaxID=94237 RepID=A0A3Q4B0Z2_MOLML
MSLLRPFSKLPGLNTANILVSLFSLIKLTDFTLETPRLAKSLPLPVENEETRPRIDLVVFIIHLSSELSLQSAEASLKYLDPGYFLGKVCFMVTNARSASVPTERLDAARKLAASLQCPLLFAEDQTPNGVSSATEKLLNILKVAAGHVPMATALYLSNLTRCTLPPDIAQPSFD